MSKSKRLDYRHLFFTGEVLYRTAEEEQAELLKQQELRKQAEKEKALGEEIETAEGAEEAEEGEGEGEE